MTSFFVTRRSRHEKLSLGVDHYVIVGVLSRSGQSSYYYIIFTIIVIIIITIIITMIVIINNYYYYLRYGSPLVRPFKTVVALKIIHTETSFK